MEEKSGERYLGDLLSVKGTNIENIKTRVAKGSGIIKRILIMLNGIPLGNRYFEVAVILRESLLVSRLLFNSEAWYHITDKELDLLETVDTSFLRKILKAPNSTPKELLFLELGCKPLRDIIRERRLSFFHYILNEKKESTINRFLWTQIRKCSKKDWVMTVFKDLNYLDIECSNLEVIKNMKKETFMKIVKTRNEVKSFERLEKTKETHSKVNKVKHDRIIMQKYLKASNIVISKEIAQQIFKIRCRVTDVKTNFKGKYDDM